MRNKPQYPAPPGSPVVTLSEGADHEPVTAEPAPVGVLSAFMAWQPSPKLVEMHANLGRSLFHMRDQIGEHLNEAANGIQRLVIDLETINRRDPGVAFLQNLIATLKGY